jgi:putative ABC transport system permease protein
MLKNPLFTLIAVLAIAIGIGANVLVFSLVERILLSSLPYPEPERLVRLTQAYPEKGLTTWGLSPANFARYRDQNRSFDAVAAYSNGGTILSGSDKPEYLQAGRVTADFFKVFGVNPLLGRTFKPGEDVQGKNNVCVISYGLWQRRLGGDPRLIGKSLVLSDVPTEVVGVMPASFKFPVPETDLWIPMALNPQAMHPFLLNGVARLRPGLAPSAAAADTTSILWNAATEIPEMVSGKSPPPPGAGLKTVLTPLKETIVGNIEKPLLILQLAVAFVLLIACANVANLLLSRATRRTHEIALRLALGATRGRIIRQLLTESLLLALVGAVAGISCAWWCLGALSRVYGQGIPRMEEAGISRNVLAATVALTVLTGILFGLVPAFRAYWIGMKGGLSEGAKTSAGSANRRMNSTLVAVQLALSLVLLIGAGLMLKSFQRLTTVNPGFETEKVLTMILPVSSKKYESPGQSIAFYKRLLENVRGLPGVNGAAVTSNIPFSGRGAFDGHVVEGQEPQGDDAPQAEIKVLSPGYFQAMGMSLQQGRDFQESDTEDSPLVAIVDQKLARQYWPNGDAIGKRIRTLDPEWYTIVGVVPTVKGQSLSDESTPHLYLAYEQLLFAYGASREQRRMYLVVNTNNPAAIVSTIRDRVRALDPDVPVYAVNTLSEVISKRLDSQRLINLLLTTFSAIALLLAAIGTYGVMSVFVNSREPEFAIRLALGAQPRNLLLSVLRQGLLLATVGTVFGLLGSWALTRAISSQLFEVSTTDPLIFTITPVVLVAVAMLACYLPARRAARTDPATVLRNT